MGLCDFPVSKQMVFQHLCLDYMSGTAKGLTFYKAINAFFALKLLSENVAIP
jgi:hypothetical protein